MTAEAAFLTILFFIAGWPMLALGVAILFERVLDWLYSRQDRRDGQ